MSPPVNSLERSDRAAESDDAWRLRVERASAELADAGAINFMVRRARGIVWLTLPGSRCDQFGLQPIGVRGRLRMGGEPMVSIEARDGVTTGISAADRARTIAAALDPAAVPEDLVQPGHVFPLRARHGGLRAYQGRTEAAVAMVRLAGLRPAGVLCEVLREDGAVARGPDLDRFAAEYGLAEALDLTSVGEAAEPLLCDRGSCIGGGRETA